MDEYLPDALRFHARNLPFTTTPAQAQRIARVELERMRHHGQTMRGSMVETVVSTFVGFWLSYAILRALEWGGLVSVSHETHILVTAIFTVASIVRGYALRRFFNWRHHRG